MGSGIVTSNVTSGIGGRNGSHDDGDMLGNCLLPLSQKALGTGACYKSQQQQSAPCNMAGGHGRLDQQPH